jgi:hypothetical protein
MIEDKIALLLKDIYKIKEELSEVKKDIKREEKMDTPEYLQLKAAHDDIKRQKKDMEEAWKKELAEDDGFQNLRELSVKTEEKLAQANEKLFAVIAEMPNKPFQMNVEMDAGPVRVQIMPEMKLYVNGKEEKRRAA